MEQQARWKPDRRRDEISTGKAESKWQFTGILLWPSFFGRNTKAVSLFWKRFPWGRCPCGQT